jgi:hypothetical protein
MTAGSAPPPDYRPMNEVKAGSNNESGAHVDAAVDPKSVGAHGMHDLSLEDGIFRSPGKNVKLGGGVRMIVRVDIFG